MNNYHVHLEGPHCLALVAPYFSKKISARSHLNLKLVYYLSQLCLL